MSLHNYSNSCRGGQRTSLLLFLFILLIVLLPSLGGERPGGLLTPFGVDAQLMRLKANVNSRIGNPLSTESKLASALGIADERVTATEVQYQTFTATIIYNVVDAPEPTNALLQTTRLPLSNFALNGTGFTSAEVIITPVVETDYTIFYVAVGSAGGGMLLSGLFICACCLRKGANEAPSSKDELRGRKGRGFDAKAFNLLEETKEENRNIRERLMDLEMQMLQVHQLDEDEKTTKHVLRELLPDDVGHLETHGGTPGDVVNVLMDDNTASGLKGSSAQMLHTGSPSSLAGMSRQASSMYVPPITPGGASGQGGSTPNPRPVGAGAASAVNLKPIMTSFYERYAPTKVPTVDKILDTFSGREEIMFDLMESQYNSPGFFAETRKQMQGAVTSAPGPGGGGKGEDSLAGHSPNGGLTPSQKILAKKIKLPGDDEQTMTPQELARFKKEHWWKRNHDEDLGVDLDPPPYTKGDLPSHGFHGVITDEELLCSNPELDRGHWSIDHRPMPSLALNLSSKITIAPSHVHGMGLFATKFIDAGTILFTWLRPQKVNVPQLYMNEIALDFKYGADWADRLRFVTQHPENKDLFCVAEDPKVRGWGCLINSSRKTGLERNCELVWSSTGSSSGVGDTPWVRTTATIPPLSELLLDYPYPAPPLPLSGGGVSALAAAGGQGSGTYSLTSKSGSPPRLGSKFTTTASHISPKYF